MKTSTHNAAKSGIKYSQSFNRDWDYYMSRIKTEVDYPLSLCIVPKDENGLTPKECFYYFESQGKKYPCTDPNTFQKVLWVKSLVNLTIKMWVEDIQKRLVFINEIEESCKNKPDWVLKSFYNQLKRL